MRGELLRLSETPLREERAWESDGVEVLRAVVTLPQCEGKGRRVRRFNRYYRQYARAYLRYCETELLPRAALSLRTALSRSAPWQCARAELAATVTRLDGAVLSLYTEGCEERLAPRLILRRAEVWDRREGLLLPLAAFFPPKTPVRKLLTVRAREMASAQGAAGTAAYYPGFRVLVRRAFNSRNFYLSGDGLHWFYPMYTVAPAAEGIVEFTLPYGEDGLAVPADVDETA